MGRDFNNINVCKILVCSDFFLAVYCAQILKKSLRTTDVNYILNLLKINFLLF